MSQESGCRMEDVYGGCVWAADMGILRGGTKYSDFWGGGHITRDEAKSQTPGSLRLFATVNRVIRVVTELQRVWFLVNIPC